MNRFARELSTIRSDRRGRAASGLNRVRRNHLRKPLPERDAVRKAKLQLERQIAAWASTERRLRDSEHSLRHLSISLLRAQDEERRRIGGNLHDSVGQYLAALKMGLESLESHVLPSPDGRARRQLAECLQLADDAIDEVRTIAYFLHPPMLEEMGLRLVIPWYLDRFTKRTGIATSYELSPGLGRLTPEMELALFRVLQESLSNVQRHSGAQSAHVSLLAKRGGTVMEVSDSGAGFRPGLAAGSPADLARESGVGLRGINERVRQLGGGIQIISSSRGTTVAARIPYGILSSAGSLRSQLPDPSRRRRAAEVQGATDVDAR
jgi:signal transduction histidine kinase